LRCACGASGVSGRRALGRAKASAGSTGAHGLTLRSALGAKEGGARRLQPVRALDPSVCLSVAQEEIAFAAALAAETYLTAKKKKELTGEDTNFVHPAAVIGVILLSSGLIQTQNDLLGKVGFLFSSIAAFAVIGKYAKRFLEAGEGAIDDWPGPKAVPAFGIFMSLMAFLASTQALTRV